MKKLSTLGLCLTLIFLVSCDFEMPSSQESSDIDLPKSTTVSSSLLIDSSGDSSDQEQNKEKRRATTLIVDKETDIPIPLGSHLFVKAHIFLSALSQNDIETAFSLLSSRPFSETTYSELERRVASNPKRFKPIAWMRLTNFDLSHETDNKSAGEHAFLAIETHYEDGEVALVRLILEIEDQEWKVHFFEFADLPQ